MTEIKENIEFITWKKAYETGVVLIDKQHRNLVDLINNLAMAHHQKHEKEVLRETILKLVEYTKFHFAFEEKHMRQTGYLKLEDHSLMHQVFVKEIVEILNTLKKGEYENLTDEILEFLKKWLTDHILVQDKDYGKFYIYKTTH